MAFITAHAPHAPALPKGIRNFFAGIGNGLVAYTERHARLSEIDQLNALSDKELENLGIRRENIVAHVFADNFYI